MIDINEKIEIEKLEQILQSFKAKKIVVLGDLMIDHYLWGHIDRISPEAPVPIVDVQTQEFRLGGAANVVNNILTLSAVPIMIGVVGNDAYARELLTLCKRSSIKTDFILRDPDRPTTTKSRIFAAKQQIIRYDTESRVDISEKMSAEIIAHLERLLPNSDALILEDYNKGLLTHHIIEKSIEIANKHNIPVTVDPKFKNLSSYRNCTVFKPNLSELQKFLNIEIKTDTDLENATRELFDKINPRYLVITLGEKGLKVYDRDKNVFHIPTFAREVFDVSGAGDTVISVLTLCLSVGCDIKSSAIIANHAAGAVCGKRGINPATVEDIIMSAKYCNLLKDNK
jgi:rfaE bifunctional protein kinase chain/domain